MLLMYEWPHISSKLKHQSISYIQLGNYNNYPHLSSLQYSSNMLLLLKNKLSKDLNTEYKFLHHQYMNLQHNPGKHHFDHKLNN